MQIKNIYIYFFWKTFLYCTVKLDYIKIISMKINFFNNNK